MFHRTLALLVLLPLFSACTETRTVVSDHSVSAQFAGMMGGNSSGSDSGGGWSVSGGGIKTNPVANDPSHPVSPGALRIAEIIRNQRNAPKVVPLSDTSKNSPGFKVVTSFDQPADPSAPTSQPASATTAPSTAPAPPASPASPFSTGTPWITPP